MDRLKEKVAIVTGGGSGIGRATCELFADEGAAVVIAELNPDSGKETELRINQRGGRALAVPTNVADEASVKGMVAAAVAAFGKINIVVNNAAAFVLKGLETTPQEWRLSLEVNVMGPALVAKHAVPELRRVGGGAIVNIGSISSFIAQPQMVAYNSAKAAIPTMTRCLALDLAADNIRVNAVCPGVVWTPTVQRLTHEKGLDKPAADVHPEWGGGSFFQRLADPREIAHAILFLASDEASFVTGAALMVDGGYTAR
jgi:dihydroanticapsin dehydrogenase